MMAKNAASQGRKIISTARPVLIIQDKDASREVLVDHLVTSGEYQLVEASSLREAVHFLGAAEARFDTILLDVGLPDGDGSDFCFNLRQQGHKMPIILLGGTRTDDDVVRGLDAGANDYIGDTTRVDELRARLRAQLRLFDNSVHAVFTIGSYTFRPSRKLLVNSKTNHRICLTNKEVDLLKFLYTSGCFVTRETLLSEIWGYKTDTPTHTLDTHIYTLRRKMEADPNNCILLITMPGGYQLAIPN